MPPGDVQVALLNGPAPTTKTIVGQTAIRPKAVNASFDGSGAAGPFLPCLVITGKEGFEVARIPAPQVAAGASAEVSWFPRVGGGGSDAAGEIAFDTDNQGGYLEVETAGASPSGHGIDLSDNATGNRLILGPTATLGSPGGVAQIKGGTFAIVSAAAGGSVDVFLVGTTAGIHMQDHFAYTETTIFADRMGFYSTPAIAKPTVTGSRGGNAALASLLTKLDALGLITNGTGP